MYEFRFMDETYICTTNYMHKMKLVDFYLSLEDEKNSYLNAQAYNVLLDALSNVVIFELMPSQELRRKLQDKYGVSKICGDDCSPSTSGRIEFSTLLLHQHVGFHKVMKW